MTEQESVWLFCEYRVPAEHRGAFLRWIAADPARWEGVLLAENETQPGVFVEIRRARDAEEALKMEAERRGGRSGWDAMEQWVHGGRGGVRVWRFRPVHVAEEPRR